MRVDDDDGSTWLPEEGIHKAGEQTVLEKYTQPISARRNEREPIKFAGVVDLLV